MALRQGQSVSGARLVNGARIGVVGAGPAGSFFSYFALDTAQKIGLELEVDIYEPRDFSLPGPGSCNMCGGIVSESLLQKLATEGINLPAEVIEKRIDSYYLHMDVGTVRIEAPRREKRIAAVHRGAGPRDLAPGCGSFDAFLLDLAREKGARVVQERVVAIDRDGDRPRIKSGRLTRRTYDLLVGAVGVNAAANRLFASLGFAYREPVTTRAYISEFLLGREIVRRYLGRSMHVFLLDIPRLKFAAVIPKSRYATVCLLGDDIDGELVSAFLRSAEVKRCMPPLWTPPSSRCHCSPRINVGAAVEPFGDRVVLVGDCAATRLYKDGIGAAYRTAKSAALTAVFEGASADDFRRHYEPVCRKIRRDNQLGKMMFAATEKIQSRPAFRRGLWKLVSREQSGNGGDVGMSSVLWDTFTGSAAYRSVVGRSLRPALAARLLREVAAASRGNSSRSGGDGIMRDITGFLGRAYKDGEVVYREGELGQSMYVIQDGQIEILRREDDKEFCFTVLGKGDFFGEMAMFHDEFHTTTARALGKATILTLDKRSFLQGIKEDPSMAYRVMRKMSRRIFELESAVARMGADRLNSLEAENDSARRPLP